MGIYFFSKKRKKEKEKGSYFYYIEFTKLASDINKDDIINKRKMQRNYPQQEARWKLATSRLAN